ncbi:MAG: NADH-quinone oxidoreductase subunit C [Desulfarculus sp.]|nr:NADH-quinone oxidoreductase subunit C [Desulfarculus sp.]
MKEGVDKLGAVLEGLAKLPGDQCWGLARTDHQRHGIHAACQLEAGALIPAARLLLAEGFFLEDVSAADLSEGVLLSYHFDLYDACRRVVLRLLVPRERLTAPSLAGVYTGADWHEREIFDFFGVIFTEHPNLKPLLLPDDLDQRPLNKRPEERRSLYALLPQEQLVRSKP